ncbi:unnamed protein product [Mytilus coruscus]|uniref:Uncharacterized protein n=1 Tax=Mytilus coruscus TaxID=42192 RepID=A0A6J8CW64_MYTCO|nr:unnamed protein product [Mytilus coruscus]
MKVIAEGQKMNKKTEQEKVGMKRNSKFRHGITKPCERKSLFRTVKDLITPTWLSRLFTSEKQHEPNEAQEDDTRTMSVFRSLKDLLTPSWLSRYITLRPERINTKDSSKDFKKQTNDRDKQQPNVKRPLVIPCNQKNNTRCSDTCFQQSTLISHTRSREDLHHQQDQIPVQITDDNFSNISDYSGCSSGYSSMNPHQPTSIQEKKSLTELNNNGRDTCNSGQNLAGLKSTNKRSTTKPGNTVQTLLAAKVDKNKPPLNKRTHSDVSNESNNSLDLSGIMNFQKDIDEIKIKLEGVTRREDLDRVTKDMIKTSDLEQVVTLIVKKLMNEFEITVQKKIDEKVEEVKNEMQEKFDALSIENEELKNKLHAIQYSNTTIRRDLNETSRLSRQADISSNYNEQYSRKNNIKIINFPRKDKQDLRKDFMETVKKELNVQLEDRDVVAIHRIPSQKAGPYPVIVKLFSSDVKRQIMRYRKELTSKIRFVDDFTQRNMSLIERLRKTDEFESVWYYNCGIYGRTLTGLQLKFGLYDDIHYRIQQGK